MRGIASGGRKQGLNLFMRAAILAEEHGRYPCNSVHGPVRGFAASNWLFFYTYLTLRATATRFHDGFPTRSAIAT